MSVLVPLLGSVGLGAIAQVSLRYGASLRSTRPSATRQWTIVWALCFAVATVLWLEALHGSDISYAYPLLGAGYVLVTLLARWVLRERVSLQRWIAVLVITAGVVMVGVSR